MDPCAGGRVYGKIVSHPFLSTLIRVLFSCAQFIGVTNRFCCFVLEEILLYVDVDLVSTEGDEFRILLLLGLKFLKKKKKNSSVVNTQYHVCFRCTKE